MSKVTVVAKVVAKKKYVEFVKSELLKLIAPTSKEDGCVDYYLHQDHDDPAVFIFYENWESEDCLARHMDSDHFKDLVSAVDGMLDDQVVNKMTRIG